MHSEKRKSNASPALLSKKLRSWFEFWALDQIEFSQFKFPGQPGIFRFIAVFKEFYQASYQLCIAGKTVDESFCLYFLQFLYHQVTVNAVLQKLLPYPGISQIFHCLIVSYPI
jgi:hypothetical protein